MARWVLAQLFVVVFVAAVAGLTVIISAGLGAHGRPPAVALILAAAVVTLALPRVRSAADRFANWAVLRERADAYELVSDFVRSAANTLPVEEVLPRLAETAARSVRSPRGEVRVWLADGGEWREAWPLNFPDGAAAVNVDVRHEGLAIGELEVSVDEAPDAAEARRRLRELAGPAGMALSTVRLTFDLRRRLEELARTESDLRASQRRLIEARFEERERFVHTIDKFVGPHLTAAAGALSTSMSKSDPESDLTTAARNGEVALDRLRSLAHGVFPVVLLQGGLAEALEMWAEEAEVPLTVRGTGDPGLARRAPTAVAVQYFACVEAVEALEPPPAAATVELSQEGPISTLTLDWSASGPSGFDRKVAVRLRDRAEAVGGTLEITPTELRVRVPTSGATGGAT